MKTKRHSSVRWRIVLIYFLLVFIAMTIMSVFLMERIEDYQMNSLKDNITNTVSGSNLLSYLHSFDNLKEHADEIQANLDLSWTGGFTQELSVVDNELNIVASTNQSLCGKSAAGLFDTNPIIESLANAGTAQSQSDDYGISVQNVCFSILGKNMKTTGVVFVRADLASINNFLDRSRLLFVQATALALLITVILSFALARSITDPIKSVTATVEKMMQGDFSTSVDVRSDDEIGQFAEMFNLLRERLDETISEINREKNKLGTILQYMADGLIAIDLEGRIIHINPAAKAALHIPQNRVLEGQPYKYINEKLDSNLTFDRLLNGTADGGGEYVFRREEATYAIRYDRFKDDEGSDAGIILIMQDMTERQKLEDMQTDFVANVSHELKTPLTNVKSYTETLLDGAMDDRETARNFLQIIENEADRMNRLVKDLLQLSRLDHKQEPMNLKESNIVVVANMAVMKVEMTAKQKGLFIKTEYDIESDIRVMLDRDRMEQVIMNLLSNAIKYTNEGGVYVNVVEETGSVRISVRDTGIGIPASSIPRIFERFYRVDKARSRAMGGTGLGLAITRQIVDEHKGRIDVSSEEGKGTCVTITLPTANRKGVRNIE